MAERIVLVMGIDRSTIGQVDLSDKVDYVSHVWAREGVSGPNRASEHLISCVSLLGSLGGYAPASRL